MLIVNYLVVLNDLNEISEMKNATCEKNTLSNNAVFVWLFFLHVIFFASNAPSLSAQPEMIVEHYTKDNGMPSNTVYCSEEDNDGFLWVGTWHGLCSFDGARFMPFIIRSNHSSDLPPRKVRNIVEDTHGNLWIRNTDNHLYLFDKVTENYHDLYNHLKRLSRNVQVIKIQPMDNGRVLILMRNKDLIEAYTDTDGNIRVSKIYDSNHDVDFSTMRLKHNVLGENKNYVYWISTSLDTRIITKKTAGRVLLSEIPKNTRVTSFMCDGRYLCLGTHGGGIYVINLVTGKTESRVVPGVSGAVSSISLSGGKMFFTTSQGLHVLSGGNRMHIVTPKASHATHSFTDKYNNLWFYATRGDIVRYDPATSQTQTFTMPSDSLFADIKFKDAGVNGLFILLRNGEVWRYDHLTKNMQNINRFARLSGNGEEPHFFDVDISKNGILWLSSTNNGLYKVYFPRYDFKFLYSSTIMPGGYSSVTNNGVRSLYQSRNGDLWVATRNGNLYCIDIKTNKPKFSFDKSDIGVVYHIMEDDKGNFWFSTKGSGLVKGSPDALSPKGMVLTHFRNKRGDKNSISADRVYYTYQDSRKRIWVCTFYGGLNLMEQHGGKTIFRHKRNGFVNYPDYELYTDVRAISEDNKGRLWVGTTDGLMSFDGKFKKASDIRFETYRGNTGSSLTENDIFTMYKDRSGYIWMGIFGNGLNKLERYDAENHKPVLTTYKINERLGGDVITSIVEDSESNLWICTESGLSGMRKGSDYIKNYDRFAGFPSVSIEDNTNICLRDGRILIGCRQGLLSFNPATVLAGGEKIHHTFIVNIKVANKNLWELDPPVYEGSLKYAGMIELKHDQSTFTIEFTSPYFEGGTSLPYTYILDGYEKEWHKGDNSGAASYANVPHGHYKFRVRVNDNSSPEQVIDIIILPPWWATWWAYTIYAVLLILIFYGTARLVLYLIKMRNEVYINDRLAELKIRFFTNVSHELRTPLSLISGPIEELKSTEKLTPSGKEYLELIERNSRKMLMLVNQILDFRKVQNGKMKLHVSLADITEMIQMLMREYRILADERDITFSFEKPEENIMLWCDAEKIGIVLNNIISNAFKYTDEGGAICIALEYDHDRKTCTVRVEDDGASIPKSQLELIFERFRQADNRPAGDTHPAGTGIGLSLSKEFVAMHHGRIWADNLPGDKGVVFSVELPTDREHFDSEEIEVYFDDSTVGNESSEILSELQENVSASSEDTSADDRNNKPLIMLIEDNIDMCRMLQLQLQEEYNVITAHEGGEGLKRIYKNHPDIVITDLMMPGISGMELLQNIRRDFNISHIPVIVLTAKSADEDKMSAIRAGANAFITKPFSRSYLMARIHQLLEEQRTFQRKMVLRSTVENSGSDTRDEYEQHLVQKDIEFVNKIHTVIEENLNANDFNIDTIAETIGLSRSAFFKKLKSLTGLAPVDLVKEIRLTKAARLIETTDDSITEIAYSVGFRDAGYFGKCFRKKYEMTPKEYRKLKTGDNA